MAPIRFASFLGDNAYDFYTEVVSHIRMETGHQMEMHKSEFPDPASAFLADEIDAGFICGLPYVLWQQTNEATELQLLAAPVLPNKRYDDCPVYFSDIIVREESSFTQFDDLRGGVFAYNEVSSCSGFAMPRHYLVERGNDFDFFGTLLESGTHAASLDAVESGAADAATIDSVLLEMEFQQRRSRQARFRVVHSLGPLAMPPIVIKNDVSETIRSQLATALLSMHQAAAGRATLQRAGIVRFENVDDTNYDDIRAILSTLESLPAPLVV